MNITQTIFRRPARQPARPSIHLSRPVPASNANPIPFLRYGREMLPLFRYRTSKPSSRGCGRDYRFIRPCCYREKLVSHAVDAVPYRLGHYMSQPKPINNSFVINHTKEKLLLPPSPS